MTAQLIVQILNMIQAGFNFISSHNMTRDHAQRLLDIAHDEQRDLTTAEVQTELDTLQTELDETADLIRDEPE